jgi:transposase
MRIEYERCCGLDVHKKTVVACLLVPEATGGRQKQTRTFSTMTAEILALADWLAQAGGTPVAMESTGVYWQPIYNLLEGLFTVMVVNAQHLKAVPGRKTDVLAAEWIADLRQHGLLRGSFIPSAAQRAVRELTRYRATLVSERVRQVERLHKVLEGTNIKLAAVATDIVGVSGRRSLQALLAGVTDPVQLAELAKGRLRAKRAELAQALRGRIQAHQAFLIAELLDHVDYLDEAIARVSQEVAERMRPLDDDSARLDTIPGINRRVAEDVLAEIGVDMSRFASARHLASWAGMCPGNNESGGKRKSGQTRHGSPWLRKALIEAAHAAARCKQGYLAAQYHRLAARRGKKKAVVAGGHTLLVIVYHVLTRHEEYRELGGNYFDERDKQAVTRRLVQRLEKLGFEVSLQPTAIAA